MKKVILLFLLVLGIVKIQAQGVEDGLDLPTIMPKISADEESKNWQRTLLLNEGQYIKIKEINKERHETIEAVKAMYPHEPEKRDMKVQDVEVQYDAEFAAVFTDKQMKEYLELNGRTEDAPEKMIAVDGKSFNSKIQDVIHNALTHTADSVQLTEHTFRGSDSLAPLETPVVKTLQSMESSEYSPKEQLETGAEPQKIELNQSEIKKED
jgi:hypothetical protein